MRGKLYIPGSELFLIPWATYRKFTTDSGFNHCAAISYYSLVSTVPFLSLIASILGFVLVIVFMGAIYGNRPIY